jgi:signal transduction histidine kinase
MSNQIVDRLSALLRTLLKSEKSDARTETEALYDRVKLVFNSLVTGYNSQVEYEPLQIHIHEGGYERSGEGLEITQSMTIVRRLMLRNAFWALSLRLREGRLEFFLIPTSEISLVQKAETAPRLKLRLVWQSNAEGTGWQMDNVPVELNEIDTLVSTLFKDLCTRSQSEFEIIPESVRYQTPNGMSLTGSIRALVTDKQRLVQAVVNQQEEVQKRIAWDIHDAVIGDVLGLKRVLGGDRPVSQDEIVNVLDRVTKSLRQICHDLTPRDLPDLGLLHVLEDLVTQLGERSGIDCTFNCELDALPDIPEEVQLHIYRIVQEAVHNILKHSQATRVIVECKIEKNVLIFNVLDNGKGFDLNSSDEIGGDQYSGTGSLIARERTELISHYCPANLRCTSAPGEGTTVSLQIVLNDNAPGHTLP